jgi:hypothetical protein
VHQDVGGNLGHPDVQALRQKEAGRFDISGSRQKEVGPAKEKRRT